MVRAWREGRFWFCRRPWQKGDPSLPVRSPVGEERRPGPLLSDGGYRAFHARLEEEMSKGDSFRVFLSTAHLESQ